MENERENSYAEDMFMKKIKRILKVIGRLFMICIWGVSCWGILKGIYIAQAEIRLTFQLKKEIAVLKKQKEEVEDQNYYLTKQRDKLQNPAYVCSSARTRYYLTGPGEQIFRVMDE